MNSPEKIAAILAIRLLQNRVRENKIGKIFTMWVNRRNRIEKLAETFLDKNDLPIEPYMPHAVYAIVQHFENDLITASLPTEQAIIDWIAESGGISGVLLKQMALGVGQSP
jgi:hypothetical protein